MHRDTVLQEEAMEQKIAKIESLMKEAFLKERVELSSMNASGIMSEDRYNECVKGLDLDRKSLADAVRLLRDLAAKYNIE